MKKAIVIGGVVAALTIVIVIVFLIRPQPEDNSEVLEIFSWWTAEGESEGLQDLYAIYNKQNPDVEIVWDHRSQSHLVIPKLRMGSKVILGEGIVKIECNES